jgi:peptidoglycan/LPS O-acetylase OafA/YrhL
LESREPRHAARTSAPVDTPPPLRHVRALDGVRGLAVLAVLAFHGGYLHGGYLGVDLFFVLSGFLITRLIVDDLVRDRFSAKEFWGRRARRLLPACWVMLAVVLVAATSLVRPTELATLRGDAFATLGYVANWWQIATSSSYFALFNTPSPLQHTWSLAIEEQLYVLWPLLLIALWRIGRRRIGVLTIAAATLASLSLLEGALLYTSADDGARVYYGTDTRAASVLIGALAAMLVWRFGPVIARYRRIGLVLSCVTVVVVTGAWIHGNSGKWLYDGGLGGLAILTAIVLAVVTTQPTGPVHRALSLKPLVAIGIISYGVYLYHWPLYVWLSPDRTGMHGPSLFALRLVATFSAATASYFLIERPYRRRRWAFSLRAAGAVAMAAAIVVAAIALPLPKRLGQQQAAAAIEKISASAPAPALVLPASVLPPSPPPPAPHRLLVVGDSVSQKLGPGFSHEAPKGVTVTDGGMTFCEGGETASTIKLGPNVITDRCADWRTRWTKEATKAQADGVMILFGVNTNTRMIDGQFRMSCDPEYDAWMQGSFTDMLQTMGQFGPVWLVLPPYDRAFNNGDSFEDRDTHTDCTVRDLRSAIAAAGPNAAAIDLHGFVCPPQQDCIKDVDGVTLRPDGLHYDGPGADIVARWLLTQTGIHFDPGG